MTERGTTRQYIDVTVLAPSRYHERVTDSLETWILFRKNDA